MNFNINENQINAERNQNKYSSFKPIYKNKIRDLLSTKNLLEKSIFQKGSNLVNNNFNNRRNNYSYSENIKNNIINTIIKVKDEESLYILLKSKQENSYFINKTFQDINTLKIIKTIIQKEEKDNKDKYILVAFLKNLPHILDNISLSKYSMNSLVSLLINIGINLKNIEFEEGIFLFRIDDIGKEFYIILSGEVTVLLPKFYKVQMDESEYLSHLIFLMKFNEKHLFSNTFRKNNKLFSINEISVKEKFKKYLDIPNQKIPLDIYLSYLNGEKRVPINEKLKSSDDNKKEVNLYGYYKITELKEGNCFGEVALKNENSLRTASIFTNTMCSFAYLDVENYNMTLKNIQRKTKLENIKFLLNTGVFIGLNEENFERKYWPLFCSRVISKGEIIFYNGENFKDEIIFIKEGEFCLETKLNIIQFNKIINYLKLKTTKYVKKNINDIFNIENNKENILEQIEKYITKNQKEKNKNIRLNLFNESLITDNKIDVNIGYLSKGEILGLDNMIYEDKYFCTAKCVSEKCEFFSLQKRYFDEIIFKFSFLQKNIHKFILLKKEFMYKSFLKVKNNILTNEKLNFIELYKQANKNKNRKRKNLKILTNTSLNLCQKNIIKKDLFQKRKIKLDNLNESLNKYFLSLENKNNKLNNFQMSECSKNSIDKKQRMSRINSSILLNLNEKEIFKKKKKKFYSPNKDRNNFPFINNNFYNNVIFGYKNMNVILNKTKLINLNQKYTSLLSNSPNSSCQMKDENMKNYPIVHNYDYLIYDNINKNEKEKINKIKRNKSEFIKIHYDETNLKNIPIMYLLKPNYRLNSKINPNSN